MFRPGHVRVLLSSVMNQIQIREAQVWIRSTSTFLLTCARVLPARNRQSSLATSARFAMPSSSCIYPSCPNHRFLSYPQSSIRPVASQFANRARHRYYGRQSSRRSEARHAGYRRQSRQLPVLAALPSCTGQGISLLFTASSLYCVPLFAMVGRCKSNGVHTCCRPNTC